MNIFLKYKLKKKLALVLAFLLVAGTVYNKEVWMVYADEPSDEMTDPDDGSVTSGEVVLKDDSDFGFENYDKAVYSITYAPELTLQNVASGGQGTGTVTYSSDNEAVATVDASTGVVSIHRKGKAVIVATREADSEYKSISSQYTLEVDGMEQTDLTFFVAGEVQKSYTDGAYLNELVGAASNVIEYSLEGEDGVATVDAATGEVTFLKAGNVTIRAFVEGNDYYKEGAASYKLRILKGEQADLEFEFASPEDIEYTENLTYTNIASGGSGKGNITYEISDIEGNTEEIAATIEADSGKVRFAGTGTFIITATKAEDDCYNEKSRSYNVTVIQGSQGELKFDISSPTEQVYSEGGTFTNIATGGSGNGELDYIIADKEGNTEDIAATIDANGTVHFLKAGTVVVTAIKQADENYKETQQSYELTIHKGTQAAFNFVGEEPGTVQFQEGSYTREANGGSGEGLITYSIIESSSDEEDIASVDEHGKVIFKRPGKVIIKAVKASDDCWEATEAQYELTIMEDQGISFARTKQPGTVNALPYGGKIYYGQSLTIHAASISLSDEPADGVGHGNGRITYSIVDGEDIASINEESGELHFENQKVGTVRVRAHVAAADYYNEVEADFEFEVVYLDVPESNFYIFEGEQGENGWYVNNLKIKAPEGYQIRYTNALDAENAWVDFLELTDMGSFHCNPIYLRKVSDDDLTSIGGISDAIIVEEEILRDTTEPASDSLKISYEDAPSVIDTVLKILSFGIYKESVQVTVSAEDAESGIAGFQYYYDEDIDTIPEDDVYKSIPGEDGKSCTFKIPAQFRGKVAFRAINNAGLKTEWYKGEETLVVDNLAPVCTVDISDDYVAMTDAEGDSTEEIGDNTRYIYDGEIKAVIRIDEANFDLSILARDEEEATKSDKEFVVVKVTRDNGELTEGSGYYFMEDDWIPVKNEENEDYYMRTIVIGKSSDSGVLEDGDYVLRVDYQDLSANKMDTFVSNTLCVNTNEPKIEVIYDNNQAIDQKYYNADRTATILVSGRNIDTKDIVVDLTARDITQKDVTFDLKGKQSEWIPIEEVAGYPTKWQATLDFDVDANYEVQFSCQDMAGHLVQTEKELFVVDKTKPDAGRFTFAYSESILDKLISAITYGYYKPNVKITVTAEDMTAGIDSITWYYDQEDGTSDKNVKSTSGTFTARQLKYSSDGSIASGIITLTAEQAAQYRGNISLTAKDRAGNSVSNKKTDSDKIIVVDTISPSRTVEYSPAKQVVDKTTGQTITDFSWDNEHRNAILYYDNAMTLTFNVNEANFYAEDVVTKVNGEKLGNVRWTKTGDIWTSTMTLSETGDYVVTMEYTDRSSNQMISYTSEQITIDTTNPVVSIEYLSGGAKGSYEGRIYFDGPVTARITVQEHNFRAEDIDVQITAQDVNGSGIAIADFASYLKNESSWQHNGDIHTASITYQTDANYSFDIAYKDLALRDAADYPVYIFAVDQANPGNLSISYSQNIFEIVLQTITFGYYNAPVQVTISAEDITSGITKFEYSYIKADGVSGVNSGQENIVIDAGEISYSNGKTTATAVFRIPGNELHGNNQFNGTVMFRAFDRAQRSSELNDDRRLVVDNVAPLATITLSDPIQTVNDISYYPGSIYAVIHISEANFVADDVDVEVTHNGNNLPVQVSWGDESVDEHTGRFTLSEEGNYVIQVDYRDRSGNEMVTYQSNQLMIDTQSPTISIRGIAEHSANREDEIGFLLMVEDENIDPTSFTPTLKAEVVNSNGDYRMEDFTSVGRIETVVQGKQYRYVVTNLDEDGIYTLSCAVCDLANNASEEIYVEASDLDTEQLMFSVNRKGSTYRIDESTKKILGKYINKSGDVVVTEINATALSNIKITLFKNDKTLVLKEGEDYRIEVTGGNGEWYSYKYVIFAKNFEDDGVYRISIYSEDEAGNVAENTLDIKNFELTFAVDNTSPNLIVTNLESDTTYPYDNYTVIMQANDNLKLDTLIVKLDGAEYKIWSEEEISEIQSANSEYTFDISGASTRSHQLEIYLKDAADNEMLEVISNFYITTNKWVQFYNNKPIFFGSIAGVVVAFGGLTGGVFGIVARRKRKAEKSL